MPISDTMFCRRIFGSIGRALALAAGRADVAQPDWGGGDSHRVPQTPFAGSRARVR
jgi:hypothetical protein